MKTIIKTWPCFKKKSKMIYRTEFSFFTDRSSSGNRITIEQIYSRKGKKRKQNIDKLQI